MSESNTTSRRMFLKSAAVAGAAALAGASGCQAPGQRSKAATVMAPKADKLRIAYIGTDGMGGSHIKSTKDLGVTCACYCDVDSARWKQADEAFPNAKGYQDYREMFDKQHKDFDAVMIGVPDHHHYPATVIAMQLGKHVYTQKPLTHTVWEARQLTKLAAKNEGKVITQMGNQGHAGEGWRLVYEWIHSGTLGDIVEVHNWTDRPIWPQGMNRPEETDQIPSTLDWDKWIGPAPERPYKKGCYHPFSWRGWWDFGAGALGDMACHTMDGMFWSLDPGYPTAIEPVAVMPVNNESFPTASMIKWEFPKKGKRKAFKAYWYDGGLKPTLPAELELERGLASTGNLFVGTKATLLISGSYGNSPRIIPEAKMKEIGKPPKMLERSPGHIEEWLMACRGEKPMDFPKSNFAYAGPFTEAILLGNVALRMGRRLEWDGDTMTFTNCPEANQYVSKKYRTGWEFKI